MPLPAEHRRSIRVVVLFTPKEYAPVAEAIEGERDYPDWYRCAIVNEATRQLRCRKIARKGRK